MAVVELRELIQRAAAGEKQAWDALVEQYRRLVRGFLGKFANLSRAEKEDLFQDVWVSLLEGGLRAFRGPTDRGSTEHVFRAYLATTTKNEAKDYLRWQGRRLEVLDPSLLDEGEKADPSPGPDDIVAYKELLERLRLCVQALPLDDQEIFWMRWRGYSYKESTETLDLPLGTVAVKYYRAKKKIKECLEKAGYEYGGKNR